MSKLLTCTIGKICCKRKTQYPFLPPFVAPTRLTNEHKWPHIQEQREGRDRGRVPNFVLAAHLLENLLGLRVPEGNGALKQEGYRMYAKWNRQAYRMGITSQRRLTV